MTVEQRSLFDAARVARDTALERVEGAADPAWKLTAWDFLLEYLRTHPTMHPNDLWAAGLPEPRELRALGPLLLRARRNGLMVPSGEWRPSLKSHLTPSRVWRSLIFEGAR